VKGARTEVYVVVVGGGKVGFYLTRTMLAKGHEVTLITFPHAGTSIVELAVGPDSPARGRAVRDVA